MNVSHSHLSIMNIVVDENVTWKEHTTDDEDGTE